MFVTIPDAPESLATSVKRERVLPQNPLEKELRMDFTDEEKALQVIAPRIIKMKVTEENILALLTMAEHYLPFATYSICYEDCIWRDQILGILRSACRLDVNPETKGRLEDLRDQLHEIEGDMTDRFCRRKQMLMEQQLQQLQGLAEEEDGLFMHFECHIANSGHEVKEELNKLDGWFRLMPHLNLRDYKIHEKLVEGLGYQRVSRKELFEVYASLLILNRYARKTDAVDTDFSDIKEYVGRVKSLLSADWKEETYDELWDAILALPAVKAIAKKTGTLEHMRAGQGYMLLRNNPGQAQFRYPTYYRQSRYASRAFTMHGPLYENRSGSSMTVVAVTDGIPVEEGDTLTAWRGAQRCGVAVANADGMFFLNVGGVTDGDDEANTGLTFTIERDGELLATAGNPHLRYTPNAAHGTPKQPVTLNVKRSMLNDSDGWYDLSGRKIANRKLPAGVYIHHNEKIIIK